MFLILAARTQAKIERDCRSTKRALEGSDPSFSWAALSLRLCSRLIMWLCQCSLFTARLFLFFIKSNIWFNAGWCTNAVQTAILLRVRTENCETVRNGCDVVSVVEVLYFHTASSIPRVAQVFRATPKTSLFSWRKGSCGWQVVSFPSWTSCHRPSSKQSPTAERLVRFGWRGLWLLGGWRSRAMGEGVTPDPRGATVPLWHPPVTGCSHLTRLDTSGSVGLTTAAGEKSSSPETPLTLYPEGLILLLQYLVMLWCLFSNHCCEWLGDVVWQ